MTLSKKNTPTKQPGDTEPPEATVPAHQETDIKDAEEPDGTDHNPNTRAETIAYEYLGNGEKWIEGIPARDLTNGEMKQLSPEQRAQVRKSDLYEKPPQTDPRVAAPKHSKG